MASDRLTYDQQEPQATNRTISPQAPERASRELAEAATDLAEMDGICPECYANVACDCL